MDTEKLYFIMEWNRTMSPNAKHRSKFKIRHKLSKRHILNINHYIRLVPIKSNEILDFVWITEITKFPNFAVNAQLALRMLMVFEQEENGSVSLVFKNKALLQ